MAVMPAAAVITLVSAVVPPTDPPKVVVPAVLTASEKAPLTVEAKLMFPLTVLVSVVLAPSVTASDRKSVVEGESVDLGGRRIIKKKVVTLLRAGVPPTASA